jgi:hypothetical protein
MGRGWPLACDLAAGGGSSLQGRGGRTCVYILCGVSPKKPLAACSCKYMA